MTSPGDADDTGRPGRRPWSAARLLVVDVEGNGQHPPDLVEVAVVPIVAGQVGTARSWLLRPPRPITWQARRVHGIATPDLADAPTLAAVAEELTEALTGIRLDLPLDGVDSHGVGSHGVRSDAGDRIAVGVDALVGHHVSIDLAVLTRSLPAWQPAPAIDTLRLARSLHPELPSHRLGALVDAFNLNTPPVPGQAHRADYDATLTARLLIRLAGDLASGGTRDANHAPGSGTGADAETGAVDLAALVAAGAPQWKSTREKSSSDGPRTGGHDALPGLDLPGMTGSSGR